MPLRHILFDIHLFDGEDERKLSQKGLLGFLEALCWWNQIYLKLHPELPSLYKSGVRYSLPEQFNRQELPELETIRKAIGRNEEALEALDSISGQVGGGEHFRDVRAIMDNGGGDCDNIACWRVAELRNAGIKADPYITWRRRPDGGMTYHNIVRWPDGSSEDPSLLLGMGGEAREAQREEERQKLAERRRNYQGNRAALEVLGSQAHSLSTNRLDALKRLLENDA